MMMIGRGGGWRDKFLDRLAGHDLALERAGFS
jgi:hypothetical protein